MRRIKAITSSNTFHDVLTNNRYSSDYTSISALAAVFAGKSVAAGLLHCPSNCLEIKASIDRNMSLMKTNVDNFLTISFLDLARILSPLISN